jgi:hypothetical protein
MPTKLFIVIALIWLCLVGYAESQCASLSYQIGLLILAMATTAKQWAYFGSSQW